MSTELAFLLGVPPTTQINSLVADIAGARRRAVKAEPGDRQDIERFEVLATQLEAVADQTYGSRLPVALNAARAAEDIYLLGGDESEWGAAVPESVRVVARGVAAAGLVPVLRNYGLQPGEADQPALVTGLPDVAQRFDAGGKFGRAAVEERFRDQIAKAFRAAASGESLAISPSGIQNPVVTEILRASVATVDGAERVDVPVEYRDGSRSAVPFPLRSLALRETITDGRDLTLRFALLSIRHTEMDAAVDGAWLRNAEISRPRKAGQTDDLVFEISRAQLRELTMNGTRTVRMEMYQTGLETAVVGFYRALTFHLLEHPGSVAVEPRYFDSGHGPSEKRNNSGPATSSPFRRGTVWAM